jgi:hypothetical protein
MSNYTMDSIQAGESWGCRFRVTVFCDSDGRPVNTQNLQLGQRVNGEPKIYESWGVIRVRDLENRRLSVVDASTHQEFVVDEANAWDYDRVEYVPQD